MSAARAVIRPWSPPDVAEATAPRRPPPTVRSPSPVPASVPLPPAFSASDLAIAREQGLSDGARLAEQAAGARTVQALENVAGALRAAAADAGELAERIAASLAGVLSQSLAAAFPALERRLGPHEAALLARAVLPGLLREPAVTVRVAPAAAAAVTEELERLAEPERARVTLEADPALGDADVRIAWRDGEARRDGATIRQAVLEALADIAGQNERDAS